MSVLVWLCGAPKSHQKHIWPVPEWQEDDPNSYLCPGLTVADCGGEACLSTPCRCQHCDGCERAGAFDLCCGKHQARMCPSCVSLAHDWHRCYCEMGYDHVSDL